MKTWQNSLLIGRLARLLFSPQGRLPRGEAWRALLLASTLFVLLFLLLDSLTGYASTLLLYPFYFWSLFAIGARRYHDRGKRAAWLLLLLLPLLGPLWVAVELGCLRGSRGENRYGSDPLNTVRDYLTVA